MENVKRAANLNTDSDKVVQIFDAAALGRSMRDVGADVLEGESTDFLSRWYHAELGEADLVIWTDDQSRVIKIQICVYGQIVEWNPIHGTRTGYVFEQEMPGSSRQLGLPPETSELIRYDRASQKLGVEQAIEILTNCPALQDDLRSKIIFNLRVSSKMHKQARERALKTWSPKIDEIVSDRAPTFWKRIKSWVLGE